MASMASKVDPRDAAAKKAAEEATNKALAAKKARNIIYLIIEITLFEKYRNGF